jgi:hypothetical protein
VNRRRGAGRVGLQLLSDVAFLDPGEPSRDSPTVWIKLVNKIVADVYNVY